MDKIDTIMLVIIGLFIASFAIVLLIAHWKLYEKAGREGWEAIVPIYNAYVYFEICGKPGWHAFLAFIPCIGGLIYIVLHVIASLELAKRFGKSDGFGVGIILLPIIFIPILAFGDAVYDDGNNPVTNYLNEN